MSSSTPSLNSFLPLTKLGQGTFSSVYKVRRVSDGGIYALKKIKMASLKQKQKANALNQIRILASLTSSHIITYKQAFFDEKLHLLCIVMEWANEGDLLKRVTQHKERKKLIPQQQIWKAASHILQGLAVLHKNSILHRDLKSANIFICDGIYKLGDLNVSKVNDCQQRLVKTQTGTPFYASPQIWRDQPYGSQSDIWSFGCIIYEMCCSKPPFNGKDLNDLYKNVQRGDYEPISKVYTRQLEQFISMCLRQRARERPSAQQLMKEGGIIRTKCDYYQIAIEHQVVQAGKSKLLSTIKVPNDLKHLNSQLPQSKYFSQQPSPQNKTAIKMTSSNDKLTKIEESIKLTRSGGKLKTQNTKSLQKEQPNPTKQQHLIPLPERIKNHINSINRNPPQQRIIRKNYNQKMKIHSSISDSRQQRQQILYKKAENVLSPIKQAISSKKRRPLSCNYLNLRPSDKNPPYYIANLNRPQSGVPAPIYNSDRKPFISGLRQKSQMYSDRKALINNSRDRDPYFLEKLQKIERDKIRCRSANLKGAKQSGYSQLRERLQARYKNIKDLPIYESQQRGAGKYNQHLKSQGSQGTKPNMISYSAALPTSLSAHLYPMGSNKNNDRYKNNENSYLLEIQNKILGSIPSKNNRYELFGIRQTGSANDSQIRRVVKGHQLYGRIQKM